jgi:hypothetical protein
LELVSLLLLLFSSWPTLDFGSAEICDGEADTTVDKVQELDKDVVDPSIIWMDRGDIRFHMETAAIR